MQPLVFLRARLQSQVCGIRQRASDLLHVWRATVFLLSLKRFPTKYPVFRTITRNAQDQLNHYVRSKGVDLRNSCEP